MWFPKQCGHTWGSYGSGWGVVSIQGSSGKFGDPYSTKFPQSFRFPKKSRTKWCSRRPPKVYFYRRAVLVFWPMSILCGRRRTRGTFWGLVCGRCNAWRCFQKLGSLVLWTCCHFWFGTWWWFRVAGAALRMPGAHFSWQTQYFKDFD